MVLHLSKLTTSSTYGTLPFTNISAKLTITLYWTSSWRETKIMFLWALSPSNLFIRMRYIEFRHSGLLSLYLYKLLKRFFLGMLLPLIFFMGHERNFKSFLSPAVYVRPVYTDEMYWVSPPVLFLTLPLSRHLHQMRLKRFFLGMLLTLIFFMGPVWFLRGLKRFTWSPTLIFLVRAPWGNTACTWGTTVEDTIPPSGPIACTWRGTNNNCYLYVLRHIVYIQLCKCFFHFCVVWIDG